MPNDWKPFVKFGMPGLALGVFFFLYNKFDWNFPEVPSIWVGPIILVFLILVYLTTNKIITIYSRGANDDSKIPTLNPSAPDIKDLPPSRALNISELQLERIQNLTKYRTRNDRCKMIIFDLDGTLIKGEGFRYSWKNIWQFLKIPDGLRIKYYNEYVEIGSITYQEWCEKCVKEFMNRRLKIEDFKKITSDVYLTKNFYNTINTIKENNIKIAIISGGVDTFLQELIPDYKNIFDEVFINKLLFNSNGYLSGVIPTEYDFQGKFDGILFLSECWKICLSQVAFVAEGRNDEFVFQRLNELNMGIGIAYPVIESSIEHSTKHHIRNDNLQEILKFIF